MLFDKKIYSVNFFFFEKIMNFSVFGCYLKNIFRCLVCTKKCFRENIFNWWDGSDKG